jgi:hypothetical protein
MTAQEPERLLNELPGFDVRGLELFGVVRGDIETNHGWGDRIIFQTRPRDPEPRYTCSSLWRGNIATYRLGPNGRLTLISYEYPYHYDLPESDRIDEVQEQLTGDYWLVFKERFFGPRVYVPARDGRVVTDRNEWRFEPDEEPSGFEDV